MQELTEVATGVWRGGTRWVNWYVVDGGSGRLTIVDAGLPAYARRLDRALAQLGRRRTDIDAVVLTHGHIDHIGMSHALSRSGATIHLHPADKELANDPARNETERPLLLYLWWPATAGFVVHALMNGALRPPEMPPTAALTDGAVVDVPGTPVATHVPGHTDGSCILEFQEHGVVFVGDLLCTVSPVTGRPACPQLQTRGSSRDSDMALASLDRLEAVTAPVVLPGHGGPWRGGVAAAVASARRVGCR